MPRILHIVPRVPPLIDGIGDYAAQLGDELSGVSDWQSSFLATDSRQPNVPGVGVVPRHNSNSFQASLQDHPCELLFLHYSGYGYSRRGIPFWLVRGLSEHCGRTGVPLAIFFHELWSTSAPWRSPFYFQPLQYGLIRKLQKLGSVSFTSALRMRQLLSQKTRVLPIPSTVPGCELRTKSNAGPLKIACFGQPQNRLRSLRAHTRLLKQLRALRWVDSLTLIGQAAEPQTVETALARKLVGQERLFLRNELARDEIADELNAVDCLLSFYPSDLATKSTTVMAGMACGCPVVLPAVGKQPSYKPAPDFISCDGSAASVNAFLGLVKTGGLDRAARNAHTWYDHHASWQIIARKMSEALAHVLPARTPLILANV